MDLTPSHHPQAEKTLAATAGWQWPYSRGSRCGIASGGASQEKNKRKNGVHSRKLIFSHLKNWWLEHNPYLLEWHLFRCCVCFWEGSHVLKLNDHTWTKGVPTILFRIGGYRFGKDVMDAEAEKTFVWGPWIDGPMGHALNGWLSRVRT